MNTLIDLPEVQKGDYVLIVNKITQEDGSYHGEDFMHLFISDSRMAENPLNKIDFEAIAGYQFKRTDKTPSSEFISAAKDQGHLQDLLEKFAEEYQQNSKVGALDFDNALVHTGAAVYCGQIGDVLRMSFPMEDEIVFNQQRIKLLRPKLKVDTRKVGLYKTKVLDRIIVGLDNIREDMDQRVESSLYLPFVPKD